MTNEKLKSRYAGAQTFLKDGCLFLSLSSIIEQYTGNPLDILGTLSYCKKQGYINADNDMTVEGQLKYLRDLTGRTWIRTVVKQLPATVPENMYTVEKWLNARTGYIHFKRRFMDTLTNSVTVKEGTLTDYYCYSHD